MEKIDKITTEILELKRNLGQNAWMLGNRLLEIKESQIYLEKYGMFEEYLEKAIDISRESAYRFMRIAKEFDVSLVTHWGVKKCDLLLSLEKPERKEVLKIHKPTDSYQEIKQTTNEIKRKSSPEENIEIDYFIDLETKLKHLEDEVKMVKTQLDSIKYKPSFKDYIRRDIILDSWEQIKMEVISE